MTGPATHASHGSSRAVVGVKPRSAPTEPPKLGDQLEVVLGAAAVRRISSIL
jgi:hypothetical protein